MQRTTSRITKPQARMLLAAMRTGNAWAGPRLVAGGAKMRMMERLVEAGLLTATFPQAATREGLEALLDYWMRKDANSGCPAYRLTREEVERALAERVQA